MPLILPIKELRNTNDISNIAHKHHEPIFITKNGYSREFDSCLQFFTNQIAQNVDYINAFEFFYCQICENNCTNMG